MGQLKKEYEVEVTRGEFICTVLQIFNVKRSAIYSITTLLQPFSILAIWKVYLNLK